jgi:hypothetical protein
MMTALQDNDRHWADAHLLVEDSSCFGFNVGALKLTEASTVAVSASLESWVREQNSVLTCASVPAARPESLYALECLGFLCVDMSLSMSLLNLKRRPRSISGGTVRLAVEEDFSAVECIAGSSFDYGRYHRDVRFPRHLADARFASWMASHLRQPTPGMRCYVMGPPGAPTAFMLAEVANKSVRWHLGGVSRQASNGLLGPLMFAGVLDVLEAEGIRSVAAKVSAANTAVLNIYSALGFHAGEPEFTLHLHLESSAHLLPPPT